MARAASLFQDDVMDQTRATLAALASMSAIRNGDWKTCHELLAAELQARVLYTNLGVVARDGTVMCSAIPLSKPVNVTDRPYFVRAIKTRSFSMGEYQVGRISGKPAINFSSPVLDDTGWVRYVVFAALNVAWFDDLAHKLQLPSDSAFEVFNDDGIVVTAYPDARAWTGQKVAYLNAARSSQMRGPTTTEAVGVDGVRRIYGIMRLSVTPAFANMYVSVAIPTEPVLAKIRQSFARSLVWAGFASAIALVLGLVGTVVYVQRPLAGLTEAVKRLAAGDLTARAGSTFSVGEFRQVIAGFDDMAANLERRTGELHALASENAELYQRYRGLFEAVPVGLYRTTLDGRFAEVNPAFVRMLGYPDADALKDVSAVDIYADPVRRQAYRALLERDGAVADFEIEFKRYDGSSLWAEASARTTGNPSGGITYIEGALFDTTERKHVQARLTALNEILAAAAVANDLQTFLGTMLDRLLVAFDAPQGSAWFGTTGYVGRHESPSFQSEVVDAAVAAGLQPTQIEAVEDWEHPGNVTAAPLAPIMLRHGIRSSLVAPLLVDGQPTGGVSIETPHPRAWSVSDKAFLEVIGRQIGAVAERLHLQDEIHTRARDMETLYRSAQHMSEVLDLQRVADDAVRVCVETFGLGMAWIARLDGSAPAQCIACYPPNANLPASIIDGWSASPVAVEIAALLAAGEPAVAQDLDAGTAPVVPWREERRALGLRSGAVLPLVSHAGSFGALVLYGREPGIFTAGRMEFFRSFAQQLATALENARLYDETARRTSELQALREIDQAISGSLELQISLNLVLSKALALLNVDAACVFLFNPATQILEHAADQGFHTTAVRGIQIRLGEGLAGRAAHQRRRLEITDLDSAEPDSIIILRPPQGRREGFKTAHAVPLIAKGQLMGVLQVFSRHLTRPTDQWVAFLETLAGQTAIAISDARQFQALQRSNDDLAHAYDATLEGWARTLELRDKETEGHTQRTTATTLRLASKLGVATDELVHIRRGALLHDIGKIAIPDAILLKPRSLSSEERSIVERHPVYARNLLAQIPFLQRALDIPYCHHEKWDGTGYPRGLKGEDIPFAARIFAIVDVWDALTSDRPYRAAWSGERARQYIRDQSGRQFDPRVVEAFLAMDLEADAARTSSTIARRK